MSVAYFDPSRISIREVSSEPETDMIIKYHCSHKVRKKLYELF